MFFFSSRRRHTSSLRDWSSDVCSSDLAPARLRPRRLPRRVAPYVAGGGRTCDLERSQGRRPGHGHRVLVQRARGSRLGDRGPGHVTVALALVAAVLYGLSDFIGGVASRRTSVWPVGLLACVGALAGSLVIAAVDHGDPTRSDLLYGLLAGVGSGTGTAFLYRGLAAGRMGVVAPVSAVGAVLIPLLVAVVGGERPEFIGWVGFALALPGIWTAPTRRARRRATRRVRGCSTGSWPVSASAS